MYIDENGLAEFTTKMKEYIDSKFAPTPEPTVAPYLTFSSPNSFTLQSNYGKSWDGTLEYSKDKNTWTAWNGTQITSQSNENNYYLYLRGTGNTYITGTSPSSKYFRVRGGDTTISGNIETLLDYATVQNGNHPAMADYCFAYLFAFASFSTIIDVSDLELPALVLSNYCYYYMFQGNTKLTKPVKILPALNLTISCYQNMYQNSKIDKPSQMLATVLSQKSCQSMYQACTLLNKLPKILITNLDTSCYYRMFSGCSLIKLSTTQDSEYINEFRVPYNGSVSSASGSGWFDSMFQDTGGTFTGTVTRETTYYTSNEVV